MLVLNEVEAPERAVADAAAMEAATSPVFFMICGGIKNQNLKSTRDGSETLKDVGEKKKERKGKEKKEGVKSRFELVKSWRGREKEEGILVVVVMESGRKLKWRLYKNLMLENC